MFTFFGLNFFDNTKFRAHRLGGIIFLLTYITAILMYIYDYDNFVEYNVPMIPSFMGVFQAVSATLTFTFLPKNQNSGYFGDKGVISYNFIKENIFYQIMTFLGGWYYLYHGKITNFWMEYVELIIVFFPYTILRPLFPTTRFSDTQKDNTRYRSEGNLSFYEYGTKFISYFYLYGKHIMGFGLMYLLYKQRITEDDMKNWGWALYLLNTGTVSISIFLHTLRFKKILPPVVSFSCYLGMAAASYIVIPQLMMKLMDNQEIMVLSFLGLFINIFYRELMHFHYMYAYLTLKK